MLLLKNEILLNLHCDIVIKTKLLFALKFNINQSCYSQIFKKKFL